MQRLSFHFAADNACAFHRQLLPARFCGPDFAPLDCEILTGSFVPDGKGWFAIHGLPMPDTILEIARHRFKGGKFFWGLDDDFLCVPDWNPAKPRDHHSMSVWQMAKDMADLIVVSTPKIADTLADVAEKVMIAPNLMDLRAFPEFEYDPEQVEFTLPVKVGWAGGITHREDIAVIDDALCEVMSKFKPTEVQICWFGSAPPPKTMTRFLHKEGMPLAYQPSQPFPMYQSILNQLRPDVWLCPLLDVPFNHAKSAIRVYEAWALRAAPIASPVGEYNCISQGQTGRYANSTAEWVSAIARCARDHPYRIKMAVAGHAKVRDEHDWNSFACRKPWLKVFARVFGVEAPEQPAKASP